MRALTIRKMSSARWGLLFYHLVAIVICCQPSLAQQRPGDALAKTIDAKIVELMDEGDIPGLSIVILQNGKVNITNYGYSDLANRVPVSSTTLFELGSCSKAFTALAVAKLAKEGRLELDAFISHYIPWFKVTYNDSVVQITIRQFLHHTSGIPWNTISKIPESQAEDAVEQTVRKLVGQKLKTLPGKKYEYATINYDVLALVIEVVTNERFESYLKKNIIEPLHLDNTSIGLPVDSQRMARGYKIGFFKAREYQAPTFRGNNAAGYVITNANDMAQWLKFHIGLTDSDMYELAKFTHERDESVALHGMSASYAMGWVVSLSGNGEIHHAGLNPNFSTYVAFRPKQKIAIALLANSNSSFTSAMGSRVMKLLAGEEIEKEFNPGDRNDKVFSGVAIILAVYILLVTAFVVVTFTDVFWESKKWESFTFLKAKKMVVLLMLFVPYAVGLYLLPRALYNFEWQSIIVWTPISFFAVLMLLIASLILSFFAYVVSLCFPEGNGFKRILPQLLLLSMLSGLANMAVITLITTSFDTSVELPYQLFYYGLALVAYLLGRRFVQTNLIRFAYGVTYDLRVKLINKILSASYQNFERLDRGRVYTALNDDVATLGDSTNMIVMLVTSFFTALAAFLYLSTIALWATIITVSLIVVLATLYFFVTRSTKKYYEHARDTRNIFMRMVNGMIDGFKELSIHRSAKLAFKNDLIDVAQKYKTDMSTGGTRFVNASLVGETVLLAILGTVAFAFPKFFPGIKAYTLVGFIVVLLYLIGPINTILGSVPAVMRLRIAWTRVQQFLKDIRGGFPLEMSRPVRTSSEISSLQVRDVVFQYKTKNDQCFSVGPIDMEARSGEIIFIIGGNGSGKTTFAKLLTGLYVPDKGAILIDGQPADPAKLGEFFSAIFSPVHLFEKMYGIDSNNRSADITRYLNTLKLEDKVSISEGRYSTLALSGGQRKRMALLQCYLKDSPIYLFDEWAADQDPEYRSVFYRVLLPEMKATGKIVIAITHDDHYFDVADKIFKMNQGRLEDTPKTIHPFPLYDNIQ